jgi:hypothetical protein
MGKRNPVRSRTKVRSQVIVAKVYPLLEDCIEGGLKAGIRKVFKYWPTPAIKEDQLLSDRNVELILNYIMVDVCERFDFPEPEGE